MGSIYSHVGEADPIGNISHVYIQFFLWNRKMWKEVLKNILLWNID